VVNKVHGVRVVLLEDETRTYSLGAVLIGERIMLIELKFISFSYCLRLPFHHVVA